MYKNKYPQQDNETAPDNFYGKNHMPMAILVFILVLVTMFLVPFVLSAHADDNEVGNGSVFAYLDQEPGFPEAVVVHGNRVFVSTPARFGTAGMGPSKIFVYDRSDGSLINTITVAGEFLSVEHALSGMVVDGTGRLYVISTQLGIIRFTKMGQSYSQEPWADPIPDLNPNDPIPPLPNDIAFDEAGNLYLTDSLQAAIRRIPATGGQPQLHS
jgi:hypothetical protein